MTHFDNWTINRTLIDINSKSPFACWGASDRFVWKQIKYFWNLILHIYQMILVYTFILLSCNHFEQHLEFGKFYVKYGFSGYLEIPGMETSWISFNKGNWVVERNQIYICNYLSTFLQSLIYCRSYWRYMTQWWEKDEL